MFFKVGDREDSNVYIGQKLKSAAEVGVIAEHIKLPRSSTQYEVIFFLFKYHMAFQFIRL